MSADGAEARKWTLGQAPQAFLDLVDPVGLYSALGRALGRAALNPVAATQATTRFAWGMLQASTAVTSRLFRLPIPGPVAPDHGDRRFSDEAWSSNPYYYGILQSYLLVRRLFADVVEGAGLPAPEAAKASFAGRLLLDALAPTNYLATNPKAMRRAATTGGASLVRGGLNFWRDMMVNGGWPSQVDKRRFVVGQSTAATKGRVVFRNELIELLQYEPVTPEVRSVPLLFCPPWINKYYILDLAPGRSLVEWAVRHGITVFCISYRNPDSSMRDVGFDDYLLQGPVAAIEVVKSITGAEKVNTLSLCLGGTLNAALVAYLDAIGDGSVNCCTYLNTLVDFEGAGVLQDVFTDARTVEVLDRRMSGRGYLDAPDMAHTFDLLRANDLVFRYVESSWLLGEPRPAFDLLAWNNDSTRMPAKMQTYYLRKCWVENALAKDAIELAGHRLVVSETTNSSYLVAAERDHIVPWRANYRATQLFKGDCRFVLSTGGHIAGVVNPPQPKARMWVNDNLPRDPDQWLAEAKKVAATWWDDWLEWVIPRSGSLGPPPPMGNDSYPAKEPAPGTYVHG